MSAVVDMISDAVDFIVKVVVFPVIIITEITWEYIGYPILEFTMGLLGIKDEDLITTSVSTQRIIQDTDGFNASMTRLALLHQDDPDSSVIEHYVQIASEMRGKFSTYFETGKNNSIGLPYTNIRSMSLPKSVVQGPINDYAGTTTVILKVNKVEPNKDEWVGYSLQNTNNYKPHTGSLLIDGVTYYIKSIDYNYDTDKYDVYCEYSEDVTTTITTTTTITITNIDSDNDNKNTVVTEHTVVVGSITGTLSDTTVELSNTDETIPIDSEVDSVTEVEEVNYSILTYSKVLTVASYVPKLYAVATWCKTSETDTEWYYWLYKIGSGTYPDIDNSDVSVGSLELMPIVTLRNNFVNTNADKTSTKYLESKELLDTLGVDIDEMTASINDNPDIGSIADAFIYLGVDLRDSTPEIDKLVYETFAQMYEDSGLYTEDDKADALEGSADTGGYSAGIQDGAYNIILGWKHQTKYVKSGIIGPVGTYSKSISGNDLIMRKQTAEEYYTVYTMTSVTGVTFIDRQGLVGTVGKDLSQGIDMPLGFFFLDSLDAGEQMRIFPYVLKLSIYAADVTHLEWYETGAFASFLKLIAIVVAVVVTVLTLGSASSLSVAIISMAEMLAIGLATGYALKLLMESSAPDWIKAIGAVALLITSIWLGAGVNSGEFLTATQLTSAVTSSATAVVGTASAAITGLSNAMIVYEQVKMEELNKDVQAFQAEYDLRQQVIDDAYEHLTTGLDVTDVQWLMDREYPDAYLRGPDAFMYKAKGEIQYDYSTLYDYSTYKDEFVTAKLQVGIT